MSYWIDTLFFPSFPLDFPIMDPSPSFDLTIFPSLLEWLASLLLFLFDWDCGRRAYIYTKLCSLSIFKSSFIQSGKGNRIRSFTYLLRNWSSFILSWTVKWLRSFGYSMWLVSQLASLLHLQPPISFTGWLIELGLFSFLYLPLFDFWR